MNPYQRFVSDLARLMAEARSYPLGSSSPSTHSPASPGAPKALIFSPHPDDEVIIGGLALRLQREAGWNVVNVAVTQGSNQARQGERFDELKHCCENIGFGLVQTAPTGLEKISPKTRDQDPAAWAQSVRVIANLLAEHQPRVILFPHDQDWNSTHVGTHLLVMDALRGLPQSFSCYAVETEFWGQMATPNLMVELTPEYLGELITALTYHVEEVKRNPYHLSLPAWMMDNVRRGSELVGGQGGAAPNYLFATLYRLRRWQLGRLELCYTGGRQLTAQDNAASLFP